ncbi:zinc ABC transporter substrate-binding protein ZnuA [Plesiomonas shigelloides]
MIKRIFLLSFLALLPIQSFASVLVSVRPLGFIAAAIADGVTDTEVLLPNGASPHDYALRPSDIKRINNVDLVVWVGDEMEPFLVKPLTEKANNQQIKVKNLSSVMPLLRHADDNDEDAEENGDDHGHAHDHGSTDLHVWMSPEIALYTAVAISERLQELFPEQKDKVKANLQYFQTQINHLPEKIGSILNPVKQHGYFVFHDGYGYFESFAGLNNVGHFTVNPVITPGARTLSEIKQKIEQHQVSCVFAEPQFRPAVIDAVARGTSVNIGTLDPLGEKVSLGKDSYVQFLEQLSQQYASCLSK